MVLQKEYELKGYVGKSLIATIYSPSDDITYDVKLSGDRFMLKYLIESYGFILIFVDKYEIINASGEVIESYDNGLGD